ncbi:endoplasmic reticulum lectin 1-like [Homarus americanus]|uniref:endoplasmic reticulum lectin 1-like n=1 Tax=Homarus americanus TaxID=6706 RepID=UPI001C481066|nr:endoplasmic reticulum lectin 1-like [Homarus americanus]
MDTTTHLLLLYSFLLLLYSPLILTANQIKGLDDAILFRVNWPGAESDGLLESPDYEKLVMTSSNNEQYQCLVPINYGDKNDDGEMYRGPNALTLLLPLLRKESCVLRLESYWTYELCHGAHIKQYREEREGKTARVQEYTLGLFSLDYLPDLIRKLEQQLKEHPHAIIPTTKIEGVNMPYFKLNYTGGTVCDLTGRPRVSHILFVCYEEGRHDIYSIKETYTCEYEIIVLSPILCQHPSYRPHDLPQTSLHCVPMNGSPKRPRSLLQIEAESLKLRSNGAVLTGDTSSGSVKLAVVEDEESPTLTSFTPEPQPKLSLFPPQPAIDQKLVEDFLSGAYCLHGGSGWWKYEFCYGRKVEQYHEDRDGSKTIVLLGEFNVEEHRKWLAKNPDKGYKLGKRHVSHLYSGGSMCDLTGNPRQVEVKLRCKESNSPSSVTLYLLEPQTCEYTLGVETSIVCPLLQHADELGLFTLSTGVDEVTADSEVVSTTTDYQQRETHKGVIDKVDEEDYDEEYVDGDVRDDEDSEEQSYINA